jgi:hypothetical protein
MENTTLFLDFEDIPTFQIYQQRYLASARIIGLSCVIEAAPFGIGKVHAKMVLSGTQEDLKRFLKFIDESMSLLENSST